MKIKTAVLSCVIGVSGCVSQNYLEKKADIDNMHDRITELRSSAFSSLSNIESISRPPINLTPLERAPRIDWLQKRINLRVSSLPLSTVLNDIMQDTPVNISFDSDVSANQLLTLNLATTRQNILNVISNQTGYGFVSTQETLAVKKFLSETFILTLPAGSYTAQQGSQGKASGEGGDVRIEGQFISVSHDKQNIFLQAAKAIKMLLKSDDENGDEFVGGVEAVPSLASITVRTTPQRMASVRQLVETYQTALSKQTMLDVQVLEFRSNIAQDQGVDWSIVKDVGQGTLNFVIPGTTAIATGNVAGLAFQGTGKWDGTSAFIRALKQQGSVSTMTPVSFLTLNTQPAHISQVYSEPYIENISTEITETTTSTSTTRADFVEGVDMMVTANVHDHFVWLRLSGKLTTRGGTETQIIDEATIKLISKRVSDINFTNKLRYGQTVVIASVTQQVTKASKSASFGLAGLGMQSTETETVETLVLLTPRRVR